ncbi:hypothetical protein NU688_00680 [Variovorax sp. ZS18.2.2]|nr:hypothetical protein [Variovorax sp. ZS18.2.2]
MTAPLSSIQRTSAGAIFLVIVSAAIVGCASGSRGPSEPESSAELSERVNRNQKESEANLRQTLESRERRETERRESQSRLVEAMRRDAAEKERTRRDMAEPRVRDALLLQEQYRRQFGSPR